MDLGATFDSINFRQQGTTGDQGGGKDDLAGYGVHSIVLQVPEAKVTRNGERVSSPDDSNAVVGVWASTERPRFQVLNDRKGWDNGDRGDDYVQVSRLGNPLVNEVIIPLGKKDMFNRTTPDRDAELYGKYVSNPELARVMNALFPGVVNAPETDRTDIVLAVLQGLPGLNQQTGKPVDTLKLNLGTPPAANPNRLGVIAGDNAGYPNGRRLADDVVDIDLRVVAGVLKGNNIKLGDGVNVNDKPFLSSFPYVGPTDSGFDSKLEEARGRPPVAVAAARPRGPRIDAGPAGLPFGPMSFPRHISPTRLLAPLAAFAAAIALFIALNGSSDPPSGTAGAARPADSLPVPGRPRSGSGRLRRLCSKARAPPIVTRCSATPTSTGRARPATPLYMEVRSRHSKPA